MKLAWLDCHRRSVVCAFLLLGVLGALTISRMPVGLFPLVDFPRIVVSVEAGDRPVDRMVIEVTRPLELALRSVPEVTAVRSANTRGSAEVSVSFGWDTDMVTALLQAESVVNRALAELPAGTRFTIRRMDPTVFPVLGLSLTSQTRPLTELRDLANFELAPALSALSGIAQVEVLGGRQSEYQVLLDPTALQAHALTAADVVAALRTSNVVSAVGRLEDRHRLYLGLVDTRLRSKKEIGNTVLRATAQGLLRLSDVAQIRLGELPEWTRVNADGQDAVLINVLQQRGANTVALATEVRARVRQLQGLLPADAQLVPYYDQSELIVAAANSVRDAILIGALLAALVLWLGLRNLRVTLVVSLLLPLVLLITCGVLHLLGHGFNIMTLGGMAAAVGLIVDDAVVMIEHIARRLAQAQSSDDTPSLSLAYAAEMFAPLAGSSAATVVVFLPLTFLGGLAGSFFRPLAITMAIALGISYAAAACLLPIMARSAIRLQDARQLETDGRWLRAAKRRTEASVAFILARAGWLVLPLGLLVLGGAFAFTQVGRGFIPHMDEGGFILDFWAPPGTSITETDRLARQVEDIVRTLPEVESYSRRAGMQLGGGLTEANEGDIFIKLRPMPRRPIEAVMRDLRARVHASVPGLEIETAQLMEDLIGDLISNPQPIEIKLFGPDDAQLRTLGATVAAAIGQIHGVVEVFDGTLVAGDTIAIRVDQQRAAIEGLSVEAVNDQLAELLEGSLASSIQVGEKMLDIRVWTPEQQRARVSQIKTLALRAQAGHYLPLERVAEVAIVIGEAQQARDNLRSTVVITARLEGRDLGSAMHEVQETVAMLGLPVGYTAEYGGIYQQQQQSFRELALVFLAALMLVALTLMVLYERVAIVIAIVLTSLLTVPGVFLGLWLTGSELDLSSMIGLTMVLGIVTEVAVFYFAEIDTRSAITANDLANAASARLRPILMTTSIAVLALLPLALGIGSGSQMQRPLAITIISGLVVAVPLVLLVLPVIFELLNGKPRGEAQKHESLTR